MQTYRLGSIRTQEVIQLGVSGHRYRSEMSESSYEPSRRHRIEVRVTPRQEALIREAADLEDQTITSFVLGTATARAQQVLEDHRSISLSSADFARFYQALEAEAVPELVELFRSAPISEA